VLAAERFFCSVAVDSNRDEEDSLQRDADI
jgi:hypothetical protein